MPRLLTAALPIHHMGGIYYLDGNLPATANFFLFDEEGGPQLSQLGSWNQQGESYACTIVTAVTFWGNLPIFTPYNGENEGAIKLWTFRYEDRMFKSPIRGHGLSFGRVQFPDGLRLKTAVFGFKGWRETAKLVYTPDQVIEVESPERLYQFLPRAVLRLPQ